MTIKFLNRPKIALTVFGLWLPPEKYRILYLIYRCFLQAIQYSFLAFNIIYMMMVWGNLEEISEGFYLLFTQATLCLKATTFVMYKNRLTRLLGFVESNIFASSQSIVHDQILSAAALKMWRLYIIFLGSTLANCVEWGVVPLFENHGERVFPFKIWMPADPSKSLHYYVGYTYQTVALSMSASVYMTVDYITVSMIMFGTAQLEIIAHKISQIPPVNLSGRAEENRDLIKANNDILNECIQQHQAVMRYVKLVENMFNVNIFFQMSGTVIIICIILLRITIEPPNSLQFLSTVNYLVTMLAQLYLYCWCGNELTNKSELLRDALYMSSWHAQDRSFRKTLALAMECMKRPIVFRAGYYIPLSRPTFVSILRCSYSYFAVLNQVNNK